MVIIFQTLFDIAKRERLPYPMTKHGKPLLKHKHACNGGNSQKCQAASLQENCTSPGYVEAPCEALALTLSASQAKRSLADGLQSRFTKEVPISCTRRRKASQLAARGRLLGCTLSEGAPQALTPVVPTSVVQARDGGTTRASAEGGLGHPRLVDRIPHCFRDDIVSFTNGDRLVVVSSMRDDTEATRRIRCGSLSTFQKAADVAPPAKVSGCNFRQHVHQPVCLPLNTGQPRSIAELGFANSRGRLVTCGQGATQSFLQAPEWQHHPQ